MQLVQPASAGRRGPLPVLMLARDAQQEAELLAQRLLQAQAEGVGWQDMAVLCRTRAQMGAIEAALRRHRVPLTSMATQSLTRHDWQRATVKLLTLHSAKGLEFPWVVVAGLQAMPHKGEPLDEALRLLYVAMTRATQQLLLSAHGDSAVVQRVQQALQAVGQRFAAAA